MGGAYIEITMPKNEDNEAPEYKRGDLLIDIELMFYLKEEKLSVHIKKAAIIRARELGNQKGFRLGLQFIEIEKSEMKILKKIIYDFQRSFLQRRLKPDA